VLPAYRMVARVAGSGHYLYKLSVLIRLMNNKLHFLKFIYGSTYIHVSYLKEDICETWYRDKVEGVYCRQPFHLLHLDMRMAFQRFPFRQEYKTLLLVKGGRARILERHVEHQPRVAIVHGTLFHGVDQALRHGQAPIFRIYPHGDQMALAIAGHHLCGEADGLLSIEGEEKRALRRADGASLPVGIGKTGGAGVAGAKGRRGVKQGGQTRGFQGRPVAGGGGADVHGRLSGSG